MKMQDFLDVGYKAWKDHSGPFYNNCDAFLQKRVTDEFGTRYFINVYCYDYSKFPQLNRNEMGFMPEVQYRLGDEKPFINITVNCASSVKEIEDYFCDFWHHLGEVYYERRT